MPNRQRKIKKRRHSLIKHWDLIATKSLILGPPGKISHDLPGTFVKLSLPWSSRNRDQYLAALKRATGYEKGIFGYRGTTTGRWRSTATEILAQQIAADTRMNKIQGGLKSWMDEAYSKVLASAWDAHTFSGTSMPSVPDGESSPAIDPTNSSDSV